MRTLRILTSAGAIPASLPPPRLFRALRPVRRLPASDPSRWSAAARRTASGRCRVPWSRMLRTVPALVLALWSVVACALPGAAAPLVLQPGEAFTRAHVERLVADLLPPARPGVRRELVILRPALPLPNGADRAIRIAPSDWELDPATGSFRLVVEAVLADGSAGSRIPVAGELRELVPVAVPRRPVRAGEHITAADVETAWLRLRELPEDTVADADALIGREALRPLWPGRPVRAGDVGAPRLVRRGETLTLVLRRPGLELTALGRALDDGVQDAVIRVMNLDSRRVVRARVTGPREAVPVEREAHP